MPKEYKLKPPTCIGIKFTDAQAQASDVAVTIKASAFSVDVADKSATFTVADRTSPITIQEGQAVTYTSGAIGIMPIAEFDDLYELQE